MVTRKWRLAGLQAAAQLTSINGGRRKEEVVVGVIKTVSRECTGWDPRTPEIDRVSTRKFKFCRKKCHRNFLLKSSEIRCVILCSAKFIVPGELCVSGLRLGNIEGQSCLWLVFGTLLYATQMD